MTTAAYVVLSYRDPKQVERLVDALRRSSPSCVVRVEHDARNAPSPVTDSAGASVRCHGLNSDWGSWEEALAGLDGLRRARDESDADLFVLVSGQDYPAQVLDAWEADLMSGPHLGWVTGAPLDYRPHWGRRYGEGQDDWTRYAYRWWRAPIQPSPPTVTALVRGLRWVEPALSWRVMERGRGAYLGVRRARPPFSSSRHVWKGWPWCALRRQLLDEMLDMWDSSDALRRALKTSIIPAEAALPTLARWVGAPVANREVAFSDWSDPNEAPAVLEMHHLDAVLASGAPFCRKVEPVRSAALMDTLDRRNRVN